MEKQPNSGTDEDEKVKRLLEPFVRQVMFMDIDYSDGTQDRFIVPRDEAIARGITETGEIPDSVTPEQLEELVELGFDPTLN